MDIHDYGLFLVELISGKVACCFPHENEGRSLIDWVRFLLKLLPMVTIFNCYKEFFGKNIMDVFVLRIKLHFISFTQKNEQKLILLLKIPLIFMVKN